MATHHLKGMTWDHPRGYRGLEAASAVFARTHDTDISWDRRSLQAFADASIADLAETYDFIVLDHPHVGQIAETGALLPLPMPQDAETASLGGSLESYVWNGTLWAYPVDAACQVAVKRADMVTPELPDWEAALNAAVSDYRLVTPLLPVDAFDMMMTLVASRGEQALPCSETAFTSDVNGQLALAILKALYRLAPAEAVGWNPINVLERMAETDDFAYSPCLFGYINYARPGFRPHILDYCDLPSFSGSPLKCGILGGAGIGVSARTEAPETATAFAQWVASRDVQSGVYLENEGQPAHRQSWYDKGGDPAYRRFLTGARATIEAAWTRPRDVWFLGFVDDVCEIFPDFFLKDRAPEDMMKDINALYQKHHGRRTAI
ncbi:sugar ABC transporter substrate-binding protein [Rhodophyticola sp. CCM32]|uniref:ABC transporter substrate-binding protein n=1 Tax=Rhodophyticola sp. CCM32 TaxID=2916397 RepID=UPI00107F9C90|nr:ABC transporter substrate-binding protein [Rhodophyticola sp. CCM32]QBX99385.1 sugar ABC transporter substrate-binding protein [Rhodophyticola sp. CCM32]